MSQLSPASRRAGAPVFAGLFFTTLSTLMYEVLLTRIFSVTMWYHFAFVAVSVALFGLTAGALLVHLLPKFFAEPRLKDHLALAALGFSVAIAASFLLHLQLPVDPKWTLEGIASATLTYAIFAVPFTCSGMAVCLTLTRFPAQVSRLYAVDLVGASLGAITLVWLLGLMKDAPSAVFAVAALAAIGAACFAASSGRALTLSAAAVAAIALGSIAAANTIAAQHEQAFIRIVHVKGADENRPLYETWNAFSRIQIDGDRSALQTVSATGGPPPADRRLSMTIDATAGTQLIAYNDDPATATKLQDDIVALAHHLRPHSRVLLIGTGGGGEVLLSLSFHQPSITAVEINGAILDAVNGRYGDFTGHLDQQPSVHFINEEGRAFVERSHDRYDIIQIPFTDTWAATGAGAFALSENGLYTVDAWETFYDHLSERGVLTVTRWHMGDKPIEAYRLVALATEALRRSGVEDPRAHIMLVKSRDAVTIPGVAVANILVTKEPFSQADIAAVEDTSRRLQFEVLLTPQRSGPDPIFAQIADSDDPGSIDVGLPVDISPPTDNRPFFFQMVGLDGIFDRTLYSGYYDYLARPVLVLFALSVAVLGLTAVCILLPLVVTTSRVALRNTMPLVVFFCAIGLGFLLIEIAQLQRLTLFLGHPTYALSVVLFSLLLFSGLGSLASERLVSVTPNPGVRTAVLLPIAALLAVIAAFAYLTPAVIDAFSAQTTTLRIAAAVGVLAPMGFLMGMPFPVGMKVASLRPDAPTAFFWGINGATSVCASVLAVAISLGWGISMAFWAGFLAYAVAALAMVYVVVRPRYA